MSENDQKRDPFGASVIRRRPQPQPDDAESTETAGDGAEEAAGGLESSGAMTAESEAPTPTTAPAPRPARAASPTRERSEPAGEEPDFRTLLGDDDDDAPVIEQGTIINGTIVAMSGDWAFVDLGSKSEGILAADELRDRKGELTKKIGDSIDAFVDSISGGEIRLSYKLGRSIRDYDSLLDARESGIPVEGRVVAINKGGYEVQIAGKRAFCPISQMEMGFTENPEVHLNRTYEFKIIEADEKGRRLVVSRAALQREVQEKRKEALLEDLEVGGLFAGTVTSVQDYGAFVDIGGLEGMIHVSELSWRRVEHPSEVVQVGDEVEVKLLGIKKTDKGERISLSLREAQPHPWVAVGTKFVEGESYDGVVTRVEAFGAFVELGPGVEGLIHVSEMSWERRINHAREVLEPGQPVTVHLKGIDEARKRIALSLKALVDNPWKDVRTKYPEGALVGGTVQKVEPFGIFVELEPGVVGLIPASESGTGTGTDLRREFEPGKAVQATVLAVDEGRKRISLSLKAAGEAHDQAEVADYLKKQKAEVAAGFGTFGDLFAKKLKR